jgi:hypothetical protein
VDRDHVSVDPPGALGPPWTDAGANNRHGGALTRARPPAAPVRQSSPERAHTERGERGARLGSHRSSGGGVATGRRRWREEITGTRWGGVPVRERRREGLGEEKRRARGGFYRARGGREEITGTR